MEIILLIGRVLFSLIFLIKSIEHFSPSAINYAGSVGVAAPAFFVPLAGIVALLGGVSVMIGFKAKIGAWLLVVFLLVTAFTMHRFWATQDEFAHMMHAYCFWKNISMLGAALMITYFGSGPFTLKE